MEYHLKPSRIQETGTNLLIHLNNSHYITFDAEPVKKSLLPFVSVRTETRIFVRGQGMRKK